MEFASRSAGRHQWQETKQSRCTKLKSKATVSDTVNCWVLVVVVFMYDLLGGGGRRGGRGVRVAAHLVSSAW